jgi:hypothetical protein
MTEILFRLLPGVSTVEQQLEMQFRDRLLDDELEELPHLVDDTSVRLFGITQRDTLYWALPSAVRANFSRAGWDENFDVLGRYSRDPNEHWREFNLDLRCHEEGRLHCLEVFGRQLICAVRGLHPNASLAFIHSKAA